MNLRNIVRLGVYPALMVLLNEEKRKEKVVG
jgi:hypothetical protein